MVGYDESSLHQPQYCPAVWIIASSNCPSKYRTIMRDVVRDFGMSGCAMPICRLCPSLSHRRLRQVVPRVYGVQDRRFRSLELDQS